MSFIIIETHGGPEYAIIVRRNKQISPKSYSAWHYQSAIVINMLAYKVYAARRKVNIFGLLVKYLIKLLRKKVLHLEFVIG